ncbi:hypothetical protein ABZ357_11275 [Streptomyces sp. NPDC005917]|uniref:hypothetical protein n=1 Tax=unclassified Streptomyces TaxID=2593676 RepID=UPI003404F695
MSVSLPVRSLRAAVFAVLCVLLAVGAHVLAMGGAPRVWVQVAGGVPVFVSGCLLGGRERSLAGIGGGTLAAQGGLHLVFDAVRPHAGMTLQGMQRMTMAPHAHAQAHALTPHATAAHVGAALVLTWWLRRGEAALWSLLRRAVALVPGLAAWWQVERGLRGRPVAPGPAMVRAADGTRSPRPTRLRYAVHRRGPPTGMSYAVRPRHPFLSTEITHPCPRHVPPCAAPAPSPP